MLLLHYALKLRTIDFGNVGVEKRAAENLGRRRRGKSEIGAPGGTCTHTLPADNGLLLRFKLREQMVGSAGNAPVRPLPVIFF